MPYTSEQRAILHKYPAIQDLEAKAKKRIPFVAWEYLQSGTGAEDLIDKNTAAFSKIELVPQFCKGELIPQLQKAILGQSFALPFGIAPVGLSGLMWPGAEAILAQTAKKYQIPYTLSTVATATPEQIGPIVENMGWFQLYPPRRAALRQAILKRAEASGFHTLVVTADVPIPSIRQRTRRAGMEKPKISPAFVWQALTHPGWTRAVLKKGMPKLRTIEEYADYKSNASIADFVAKELGGTLSWEYCKILREEWKGPLVLKGLLHPKDVDQAIAIGFDGIIVSNHGGRQFDGAPPAINVLPELARLAKGKTAVIYDSGIRNGLDILRALHLGAEFVLLGRAFLYGVAALGEAGGDYVTALLEEDLINNMLNLGMETV